MNIRLHILCLYIMLIMSYFNYCAVLGSTEVVKVCYINKL